MRRSAVLRWLIRHPAVVAWVVLLPVLFGGFRLASGVRARFFRSAVQRASSAPLGADYVPDEVLVAVRPGDAGAAAAAVRLAGGLGSEAVPGTRLHRVKLPAGRGVLEAVAALQGAAGIEWAEPNYRVHTFRVPEGPRFEELWGMRNVGRSFKSRSCGDVLGSPGSDISAEKAWDQSRGSRKVIVGIVDTGIDYTHPNLKENMWVNPGEIPGNGKDDDRNGYVDDVYGYDFVNRKGDPKDDHGHGTHVAGTIGASGKDGVGVVGVNWEIRLMALKFLDENGFGTIAGAAEALAYARKFGVGVTNNSWGGGGFTRSLYEQIKGAPSLFVAAAGNARSDNDLIPSYPAAMDLPNIVAIAASDPRDDLGCFSNWGQKSVDVGAPGVAILSTLPTYPCTLTKHGLQQGYDYLDGTSMATPHAAGAAGLLLARFPEENEVQRKHRMIATARGCGSLDGLCVGNGCLDLRAAVTRRLVPPIAEAGGNTAVPPGYPADLDASASQPYPGRNLASFVWSENGKVLRRSRRAAYTYRSDAIGTHRIDLEVVDNEAQAGHDSVRVQVAEHVMAGAGITLEREDAQTIWATLTVQDVVTKKPVENASATLLLIAPGPMLFRAMGRTNQYGQFHAEWKMPFRLLRGTYEARLQDLSHSGFAWDRKQTSGTLKL